MAGHSKWANIKHRKGAQGGAWWSRRRFKRVRAAERPATEGRAGDSDRGRCGVATDGLLASRLCGARSLRVIGGR